MTTIRHAFREDAAAIARVHVAAWRTAYRGLLPDSVLDGLSEEQRLQHWQTVLAGPGPGEIVLVAEQDGEVVGFLNGGPERKGDPQHAGEVYALYLLDVHRGQGLGTALFREAANRLAESGLSGLKVWVLRDNPCRRFYEKLDGVVVGEETVRIGGTEYAEVAYGWDRLPSDVSG